MHLLSSSGLSTDLQMADCIRPNSCCIAAAIRFYYLYKGEPKVQGSPGHSHYSYATREYIWGHIEPSCSIVAACLPTYGPIFIGNKSLERWMNSLRSFMSLRSNSGSSYRFRTPPDGYERDGVASDSGLVLDNNKNGQWQKLGKTDSSDNESHARIDTSRKMQPIFEQLEAQ